MDVRKDVVPQCGSAKAQLHLGGKRLLLCAIPTPVTPHWNARLAFWATAHG